MTAPTAIARDEHPSYEAMAIVEKYESFLNYLYPKIQNCPRKHGVVRDAVLAAMFAPVPAFHAAGKSGQISRLYAVDADLAALRFWLRFIAHPDRRIITDHQRKAALAALNEVGRMLGSWIGKKARPQQDDRLAQGHPVEGRTGK